MNNGKIWYVVKPSVGLPLFLGGVWTISFVVHYTSLKYPTWFPALFGG